VKESTLPHDPNVKLPAAVRAAAARSDEIIAAMKAQQEGATSESNPADGQQPAAESTFQPAESPTEPTREAPETKPQTSEDDSTWERRYNSMKGRFERSQSQIKDMSEQIQNMQQVISTMQVQTPSQPLPELKAEKLLTADEERDYGEDFLKVVGKKAKEELVPELAAQARKIAELEKRLQGVNNVVAQDSHGKLMATLDEKLPSWRDLNTNDDFLDWLKLPDPFSGAIRHDMLKAAYAAGNPSRVLAFFNGFLAEEAAVAPAPGDSDDVPTEKVAKVPLAKLAAPGRAKTAAGNSAPAEKPYFTRAQIAQFYANVANGSFRGKDAEKNRQEAEIFSAQREGRIR
jgi:hypothetical protein